MSACLSVGVVVCFSVCCSVCPGQIINQKKKSTGHRMWTQNMSKTMKTLCDYPVCREQNKRINRNLKCEKEKQLNMFEIGMFVNYFNQNSGHIQLFTVCIFLELFFVKKSAVGATWLHDTSAVYCMLHGTCFEPWTLLGVQGNSGSIICI